MNAYGPREEVEQTEDRWFRQLGMMHQRVTEGVVELNRLQERVGVLAVVEAQLEAARNLQAGQAAPANPPAQNAFGGQTAFGGPSASGGPSTSGGQTAFGGGQVGVAGASATGPQISTFVKKQPPPEVAKKGKAAVDKWQAMQRKRFKRKCDKKAGIRGRDGKMIRKNDGAGNTYQAPKVDSASESSDDEEAQNGLGDEDMVMADGTGGDAEVPAEFDIGRIEEGLDEILAEGAQEDGREGEGEGEGEGGVPVSEHSDEDIIGYSGDEGSPEEGQERRVLTEEESLECDAEFQAWWDDSDPTNILTRPNN